MRIKKISLITVSLLIVFLVSIFSFGVNSVAAAPRKNTNKHYTKIVKKAEPVKKKFRRTEPEKVTVAEPTDGTIGTTGGTAESTEGTTGGTTEGTAEDTEGTTEGTTEEATEDTEGTTEGTTEEATEDTEETTEETTEGVIEEVIEIIEETISRISKYFDGFETGSLSGIWNKEYANTKYASQIVDTTASKGNQSWRSELRKNDPMVNGGKRAEIALDNENPLEEHWYSVSVYLPSSAEEDYVKDETPEILMQWHNVPDPGEEWTSPPLSLWTMDGRYYISRYWDDDPITTTRKMNKEGKHSFHDLGSYERDKGEWVDWDFHVKWGWLEAQEPILEVYKNGNKVLDCNGLPNTTNDQSGVYMKVGIYKWEWNDASSPSTATSRVVYYDNVQIDEVVKI